jgi:hypothetical protein
MSNGGTVPATGWTAPALAGGFAGDVSDPAEFAPRVESEGTVAELFCGAAGFSGRPADETDVEESFGSDAGFEQTNRKAITRTIIVSKPTACTAIHFLMFI